MTQQLYSGMQSKLNFKTGPTSEQFLQMNQDENLFSMFELLGNIGPIKTRVDNMEQHMYYSAALHSVTASRLRLLEYKSIDNEARQRQKYSDIFWSS